MANLFIFIIEQSTKLIIFLTTSYQTSFFPSLLGMRASPFCHLKRCLITTGAFFTQSRFSSLESQVWKRSMPGSPCRSALFTSWRYWAMPPFCWSSRPSRPFGSPCSTFWPSFQQLIWPFLQPPYPACWVSSGLMHMRLTLELVWLRWF